VVGVSDRYSFEIRPREGSVIRVEKTTPLIPLSPEERRQHEDQGAGRQFSGGESVVIDAPPAPEFKPAYRVSLQAFGGDHVWGIRWGEFDEPYVVRYRLTFAG
jgi:hypothetical protein